MLKLSYSSAEFKNFHGDNSLVFRFREGKFFISKNVLKLSYSNVEFKNFTLDNTPDSRFRSEESLFHSPKMYQNSPTAAMQNPQKNPDPHFGGKGGESCLLLKLCLAMPLAAWVGTLRQTGGEFEPATQHLFFICVYDVGTDMGAGYYIHCLQECSGFVCGCFTLGCRRSSIGCSNTGRCRLQSRGRWSACS